MQILLFIKLQKIIPHYNVSYPIKACKIAKILLAYIQELSYYSMLKKLIAKLRFGSCKTNVEKTETPQETTEKRDQNEV